MFAGKMRGRSAKPLSPLPLPAPFASQAPGSGLTLAGQGRTQRAAIGTVRWCGMYFKGGGRDLIAGLLGRALGRRLSATAGGRRADMGGRGPCRRRLGGLGSLGRGARVRHGTDLCKMAVVLFFLPRKFENINKGKYLYFPLISKSNQNRRPEV